MQLATPGNSHRRFNVLSCLAIISPMAEDILDFDDYSSLDDREMIEVITKQLAALRDEAQTNPDITEETLATIERALENYTAAAEASENADHDLAISTQRLKLAAENLLTDPNIPNAKPIPILAPKKKGN